jgi:ADP-ribose pyrophosphatase YjhB (NUDIX family)
MPPDPKVHVGVAAIVSKPDDIRQVLMIRRVGNTGYAADGHDTWSVPGGWLEHGEYLGEAVAREVTEETGVRVRAQGQIGFRALPIGGA